MPSFSYMSMFVWKETMTSTYEFDDGYAISIGMSFLNKEINKTNSSTE